jgi:hypothetical protein
MRACWRWRTRYRGSHRHHLRAAPNVIVTTHLIHRRNEIQRTARQLEQREWPRMQMLLIVALAATFGFLTTVAMLHGGVAQLWIRYATAVTLAYSVFLALLWHWLYGNCDDGFDFLDLVSPRGSARGNGGSGDAPFRGGGGQFGGGGSTGSFGDGAASSPQFSGANLATGGDGFSLPEFDGGGLADLGDVGEAWPLAVVIAAMAGIIALVCAAFACLWIVWSAPVFMAELLVDAALARGLYRRMIGAYEGNWFRTALRHTFWPFIALVVLAVAAGALMQAVVPGAVSMGEFIRHVAHAR